MVTPRTYFADIGRRGGIKSRRSLDPETARRMVAIREARRAATRVVRGTAALPQLDGTPRDTSPTAQAIQDAMWRRVSPAARLGQVARLSRMVDQLSMEGLRRRHPMADVDAIQRLRAELRLGDRLADEVYGRRRSGA
jgi:hypothetical protein